MFNQDQFANLLRKINETYSTMTDFAKSASFDRTYISKYINKKLDNPPTPKILEKIANSSNGLVTYEELMEICGYASKTINDSYKKGFMDVQKKLFTIGLSEQQIEKIYKLFNSMYVPDNKFQEELSSLMDTIPKEKLEEVYIIINSFLEKQVNFINDYEFLLRTINSQVSKPIKRFRDNRLFNIPILGKIAAGQPILADEYIEGYLPVDPNIYGMTTSDDYFYLLISGNSMNLKVKNGDYALIHKQDYAENGDIIVAIVNGDEEATLKKYKKINDNLIVLEPQSDDPNYEPIYIDASTKFQIIGKAIGQFGKF